MRAAVTQDPTCSGFHIFNSSAGSLKCRRDTGFGLHKVGNVIHKRQLLSRMNETQRRAITHGVDTCQHNRIESRIGCGKCTIYWIRFIPLPAPITPPLPGNTIVRGKPLVSITDSDAFLAAYLLQRERWRKLLRKADLIHGTYDLHMAIRISPATGLLFNPSTQASLGLPAGIESQPIRPSPGQEHTAIGQHLHCSMGDPSTRAKNQAAQAGGRKGDSALSSECSNGVVLTFNHGMLQISTTEAVAITREGTKIRVAHNSGWEQQ